MADASETGTKLNVEKPDMAAHRSRSVEIMHNERQRILNAATRDKWRIASKIAARAKLSTSKTGRHLQYWVEKKEIEKRPVQSGLSKQPAWKTGSQMPMHPQYEYRRVQAAQPATSPGG